MARSPQPSTFTARASAAVCSLLLLAHDIQSVAQVLPSGASVVSGQVHITAPTSKALTITQSTNRAVIDWNSFSIGAGNSVNFVQPGSNAAVLNRVTGNTTSSIAGDLSGNGQVYLINPNGIAITRTGTVRVGGGFVGSTLDISNQDFLSGRLNFAGNGASSAVSNAGSISAGPGGFVALLGGTSANSGTITVPLGKVALGSAERATLDLSGDGFLQVAVPTGAVTADGKPLVDESGHIVATGGTVQLSAATVAQALRDAVHVSGSIDAHSISGHEGLIIIDGGEGGTVDVSGRASTAGANAPGGVIVATGTAVTLAPSAHLDASGTSGGTVLVGGDHLGGSGLRR